jgi:hypothetical protein
VRAPGAELAALHPRRAAAALARYRDVGSTGSFFTAKAKARRYPSRLVVVALAKEIAEQCRGDPGVNV